MDSTRKKYSWTWPSKLFERRKNVYYHVIYAVIANFGKQQKSLLTAKVYYLVVYYCQVWLYKEVAVMQFHMPLLSIISALRFACARCFLACCRSSCTRVVLAKLWVSRVSTYEFAIRAYCLLYYCLQFVITLYLKSDVFNCHSNQSSIENCLVVIQ